MLLFFSIVVFCLIAAWSARHYYSVWKLRVVKKIILKELRSLEILATTASRDLAICKAHIDALCMLGVINDSYESVFNELYFERQQVVVVNDLYVKRVRGMESFQKYITEQSLRSEYTHLLWMPLIHILNQLFLLKRTLLIQFKMRRTITHETVLELPPYTVDEKYEEFNDVAFVAEAPLVEQCVSWMDINRMMDECSMRLYLLSQNVKRLPANFRVAYEQVAEQMTEELESTNENYMINEPSCYVSALEDILQKTQPWVDSLGLEVTV